MVSSTGMPVYLLPELRFPIAGQMGHGDQIIHKSTQTIYHITINIEGW